LSAVKRSGGLPFNPVFQHADLLDLELDGVAVLSVLLSARAFRSADLFAGVILLGVIGYLTSLMMSFAEARLLGYRRRIR
jgi:ABC-type nitrate/sulfonate/bicarbonate transport system permease component